ncbi:hypothetical protein GGX14DRAFT_543496 [Mycena pura]|uniref:Nephrocystin 3-like N-terminal domain-containing protein n=1 Tax=Mycena pura TaxID=153505 RepID=A0AAD6VD35_9AGAR|nr:hypothetical protein GGX14DRAFT_543496 [Mycena pura]
MKAFNGKIAAPEGFLQKIWWAKSAEKVLASFRRQVTEHRAALSVVVGLLNSGTLNAVEGGVVHISRSNEHIQNCVVKLSDQVDHGNERIHARVVEVGSQVERANEQIQERVVELDGHISQGNNQIENLHEGVSGLTQRLEDQMESLTNSRVSEMKEKLNKWLKFPPSMVEKQHETQKFRHGATGSWFLDSRKFMEWTNNQGVLWLKGNSGTGKSVLSSTVIQKLFADKLQTRVAIAYFYFDFRAKKKQDVEIMLRAIILQLSAQSPEPYAALDQHYELSQGRILPTYQDLLDVLQKLLLELGHTYIILDALDECNDDELLLVFISSLRGWTQSPLHLLVASQPRESLAEAFEDVPQVSLELESTVRDITVFVSAELRSKRYLEHFAHHAEEVTTKVVKKSNGMFRLAACLLHELSRKRLNPDLDTILANLPGDLFGIYSRFLKPIDRADFVHVAAVLRLLVFSRTSISLLELDDILAFIISDPLATGCPYYTLQSLRSEEVVSLAHGSVEDYVMSDKFTRDNKYNLKSGPSHTFITQWPKPGEFWRANEDSMLSCTANLEIFTRPSNAVVKLFHTLTERFVGWGNEEDLCEAEKLYRSVISLNQDCRDIDEAVQLLREGLTLCPPPHPDRHTLLDGLVCALNARWLHLGAVGDCYAALDLAREALALCPPNYPSRAKRLHNCATALIAQYEHLGDVAQLAEAVLLQRESLSILRPTHPDRAAALASLATCLRLGDFYDCNQQPDCLDKTMMSLQDESAYAARSPLARFAAAERWISIALKYDHHSVLNAYRAAIGLLTQLAAFDLDVQSRLKILSKQTDGLGCNAAVCAIGQRKYELALELLEASRLVFWSQSMHLRTSLDDLRVTLPELSEKVRSLIQELQQKRIRSQELNDALTRAINSVRHLPGFEDFMWSKCMAALRGAAVQGPVVVLLSGESSGHALVLTISGEVQHVHLPSMSKKFLQLIGEKMQALKDGRCPDDSDLGPLPAPTSSYQLPGRMRQNSPDDTFIMVLAILWKQIAHPVIEVLGLQILRLIPSGQVISIADYMVSSYTPNLAALLAPQPPTAHHIKVPVVIQPQHPGFSCLPLDTTRELCKIESAVPKMWLTSFGTPGSPTSVEQVLCQLRSSSIVHFACHGRQDVINPLQSALYIGAGDQRAADEAMHLSASLLFAGFCSVVGTMWTIYDSDGPDIVEVFYQFKRPSGHPWYLEQPAVVCAAFLCTYCQTVRDIGYDRKVLQKLAVLLVFLTRRCDTTLGYGGAKFCLKGSVTHRRPLQVGPTDRAGRPDIVHPVVQICGGSEARRRWSGATSWG